MKSLFLLPVLAQAGRVFKENFDTFNLATWQHEMTLGGGGNWEFQAYLNNRSNSYVHDNTLFIKPTLTAEYTADGENFIKYGTLSLWAGTEYEDCTNNGNYGCERTGDGYHYVNPVISARVRTLNSFSFKYGKVSFD